MDLEKTTKKKDQPSTDDFFVEYSENWLLKTKLNLDLVNSFRSFFYENKNFLLCDKENYATTGNANQYWVCRNQQYVNSFLSQSKQLSNIINDFEKILKKNLSIFGFFNAKEKNTNLNLFLCNMWYVEGEEGSYQEIHDHGFRYKDLFSKDVKFSSDEVISLVVYLEDDGIADNKNEPAGCVYFVMKTGKRNIYDVCEKVIKIYPSKNDLLIFPSYLLHGTYPQKKGKRTILSFDYLINFLNLKQQTSIAYI